MGTDWAAIYGGSTEYILQAFKSADQYLAEDTILFYNDYNDCDPVKAATICRFLKEIREVLTEGRKLGAGMQGHHDMLTPTYETIETATRKYAEIADVVHITELDIKSSVGFDGKIWKQSLPRKVTDTKISTKLSVRSMRSIKTIPVP